MKSPNRPMQSVWPPEGTRAMLCHMKYTKTVRQLARMARKKAMNRDVLYHQVIPINSQNRGSIPLGVWRSKSISDTLRRGPRIGH
jgi:hypothetical protein